MKVLNKVFAGYGVELHSIMPFDLLTLRRWSNSRNIRLQMVDTSYVSPSHQRHWFEKISQRNDEAHWVVWCKNVRAGYMTLQGNDPLESQPVLGGGLYVGDSKVKHGLLGYSIALMQLKIVFEYLRVPEYKTSFRDTNMSARKFNNQLGYREVNHEDGFIWVAITPGEHAPAKKRLVSYFKGKN